MIFLLFADEPPFEFEFILETNEGLPAERALGVTAALVRAVRSHEAFPDDGQIEIISMGIGSFRTKLRIWGIAFATIGSFGLMIEQRLKAPNDKLAECVAWTMIEDGVTKVGIKCDGNIEVLRDEMPAVDKLLAKRNSPQSMRGDDPLIDDGTSISVGELVRFDKAEALADAPMLFRGTVKENEEVGLALHQHDGGISPISGFETSDGPVMGQKIVVRASVEPDNSVSWASYALRVLEWWDDPDAEMEWDLEPGSDIVDMQRLPSEDRFAKRGSYLNSSSVELRSGKFSILNSRIIFESRGGQRFLISGEIDLDSMVMGEDYIVEAQTGIDDPEFDLPMLYIKQLHHEPRGA